MTFELQVRVAKRRVEATLDWETPTEAGKDAARGSEDIADDPVKLKTVRLLQQWLSRWQVISEIGRENASFPVQDTFRVLGEHLYQILFTRSVDAGFSESYQQASRANEELRVMLSFANDSSSSRLAMLPWEFLCRPEASQAPFYLANQTRLVLNRFIPGIRRDMPLAEPPLRVLFIMCVPESGDNEQQEHMEQRQRILDSIDNLQDGIRDRLDIRVVKNWNVDEIMSELKIDPHVVHIIGHARHIPDGADGMRGQIELPGADGSMHWSNTQDVVELLTRGKSQGQLARLMILHLCEMKPVDFTASFERLAPELIKAGILSVLAMQYPMSANVASKFMTNFYGRLAAGDEVDGIVQHLRWLMPSEHYDERLIGTPVLYMQSLGSRLVARTPEVPGAEKTDAHQLSTRPTTGASGIGERLTRAMWANADDEELAEDLGDWISATRWPDDAAQDMQQIRQRMKIDPFVRERFAMYKAMLQELSEGSDGTAG
jgi:hypothetical protein